MLLALFWLLVYGVVLLGVCLALAIGLKRPVTTWFSLLAAVAIIVIVAMITLVLHVPQLVYTILYPGVHEQWPLLPMTLATILWLTLLIAAYPVSFYLYLAVDEASGKEYAAWRHERIAEHSHAAQLWINPRPRDNVEWRQKRAKQAAEFFEKRQAALEKRRQRAAEWWWLIAIIIGFLLAFAWPYAPLATEFGRNVR